MSQEQIHEVLEMLYILKDLQDDWSESAFNLRLAAAIKAVQAELAS